MTELQIIEFSKLELAYLEGVRNEDPGEQLRIMELILFWIKKQLDVQRALIAVAFNADSEMILNYRLRDLTADQKAEFGFLQMAMIVAAGKGDRELMVNVEIKMREWFDLQMEEAANKEFKPKMKIIKGNAKN
jgi:hypothetical protein